MAKFNEIPSKPRARGRGRYEFTVSVSKARKARKGGKR